MLILVAHWWRFFDKRPQFGFTGDRKGLHKSFRHKKLLSLRKYFPRCQQCKTPPPPPIHHHHHHQNPEGMRVTSIAMPIVTHRTLYFHTDKEYLSRVYVALSHNIVASAHASARVPKTSKKAEGRVTRPTNDAIVTIPVRSYTLRKQNRDNKNNKQEIRDY